MGNVYTFFVFLTLVTGINYPSNAQLVRIDSLDKPQSSGHFCEMDANGKGHVYFQGNLICTSVIKPIERVYDIYKNNQLQSSFTQHCYWLGDICPLTDSLEIVADKRSIFQVRLSIGDSSFVFDSIYVGLSLLSCGQSNNMASNHQTDDTSLIHKDIWIRSWGKPSDTAVAPIFDKTCYIADANLLYSQGSVGLVDFTFAQKLKDSLQLPICIINGAVSSTTIAQHQRDDANPLNQATVYGRMLRRYRASRFKKPLAIIWHQGEADMITDITVEEYAAFFTALCKDWREDYHAELPLIVVQVHTAACYSETLMSLRIANLQRTLGDYQVSISGIANGGTADNCHFSQEGYAQIGRNIWQVWEGNSFPQVVALGKNENNYFVKFSHEMANFSNIEHIFAKAGNRIISPLSASISGRILQLDFPENIDTIAYTAGIHNTDTLAFLRSQSGLAAFTFYLPTQTVHSIPLSAYPNPCHDFLFLSQESAYTIISDLTGRIIAEYPEKKEVLDFRAYPSGLYIVNILGKGNLLILKQ